VPKPSESALAKGAKAVPWAALLRVGVILAKRWAALSDKERARLSELVRRSRGRTANLSVRQRLELRRLARKLDLKGMGRELLPLVAAGPQGRRLRGRRSGRRHERRGRR
jgi:hypothetical protein